MTRARARGPPGRDAAVPGCPDRPRRAATATTWAEAAASFFEPRGIAARAAKWSQSSFGSRPERGWVMRESPSRGRRGRPAIISGREAAGAGSRSGPREAGGPGRRLTSHEAGDSSPAISPEGGRVAFVAKRVGTVYGFHRNFGQWSRINRGTPERPGLVLTLERGGCCRGIVYRVAPKNARATWDYLWEREMNQYSYQARHDSAYVPIQSRTA